MHTCRWPAASTTDDCDHERSQQTRSRGDQQTRKTSRLPDFPTSRQEAGGGGRAPVDRIRTRIGGASRKREAKPAAPPKARLKSARRLAARAPRRFVRCLWRPAALRTPAHRQPPEERSAAGPKVRRFTHPLTATGALQGTPEKVLNNKHPTGPDHTDTGTDCGTGIGASTDTDTHNTSTATTSTATTSTATTSTVITSTVMTSMVITSTVITSTVMTSTVMTSTGAATVVRPRASR